MATSEQSATLLAAGISRETLADLEGGLRGELLRPGSPGYDAARRIWNGMVDKHPAVIVRCAGVSDAMRAVRFARDGARRSRCAAAGTTSPETRCATEAWCSTCPR